MSVVRVWIKCDGAPRAIKIEIVSDKDVNDLLEAFAEKTEKAYGIAPQMVLFVGEQKVNPGVEVSDLPPTSDTIPLRVKVVTQYLYYYDIVINVFAAFDFFFHIGHIIARVGANQFGETIAAVAVSIAWWINIFHLAIHGIRTMLERRRPFIKKAHGPKRMKEYPVYIPPIQTATSPAETIPALAASLRNPNVRSRVNVTID